MKERRCRDVQTHTHMKWVWIGRPVTLETLVTHSIGVCLLPLRESFVLIERQRGYRVSPFRVPRIILAPKTMTSSWLSLYAFVWVFLRDTHVKVCVCETRSASMTVHMFWPGREREKVKEAKREGGSIWSRMDYMGEGGRAAMILMREIFLSSAWLAFSPIIVCPRWNDLYTTLVRAGGNVKHANIHIQHQAEGSLGFNRKFLYSLSAD